MNMSEEGTQALRPRRGTDFGPAIHGRRHDDLRSETLAARATLPLFEQRKKGEGKPVRTDRVGGQSLVEVLLRDLIEVRLHERVCLRLGGRLKPACGDPEEGQSW